MTQLILSFFAGVLTVAAPCVLPLLPVIVGGSIAGNRGARRETDWTGPLIVCGSLVVSIVLFTLALKATTALLGVPQMFWSGLSGLLVTLLGIHFVYPKAWETLNARLNLSGRSGQALSKSKGRDGVGGKILLGAALGPAFNSCSPTYALILATILPASFAKGFGYLLAYALGLALMLLLIAYAGQGVVRRLGWLADPHGKFIRIVGVVLVIVGVSIAFGLDRQLQTYILDQGWYQPIEDFERDLGL